MSHGGDTSSRDIHYLHTFALLLYFFPPAYLSRSRHNFFFKFYLRITRNVLGREFSNKRIWMASLMEIIPNQNMMDKNNGIKVTASEVSDAPEPVAVAQLSDCLP